MAEEAARLLVQQFYNNPKYADFLNTNVILYRATAGDKIGDSIYERFQVNATPTELFVDKDGQEVDWIVGYGPPADKFLEKVKNSIAGIDTYGALDRALRQGADQHRGHLQAGPEVRQPL